MKNFLVAIFAVAASVSAVHAQELSFQINQIEPGLRATSCLVYPAKGEFLRDAADAIQKIELVTKNSSATAGRRLYALAKIEKFFAATDSEFAQTLVLPALTKSRTLYAKAYTLPAQDLGLDLALWVAALRAQMKRVDPAQTAALGLALQAAAPLLVRAQLGRLADGDFAGDHDFFALVKNARKVVAASAFDEFWNAIAAWER